MGACWCRAATADAGPGTATIMCQIAADASGVPVENIRFELGDSALPPAPGQFGSHTAASVGAAVHAAGAAVQQQLLELARRAPAWARHDLQPADVAARQGRIRQVKHPRRELTYAELLREHNLMGLDLTREVDKGPEQEQYSGKSFCANFVEVRVHEPTGVVRVSRVVSALDVGRVLNANTARSQVLRRGRLGHWHGPAGRSPPRPPLGPLRQQRAGRVPAAGDADIPDIDVVFIDAPDPHLNPMGAKGMGEIGLIGFTAAVANAVYHATGRRIRELPLTPDKVLGTPVES